MLPFRLTSILSSAVKVGLAVRISFSIARASSSVISPTLFTTTLLIGLAIATVDPAASGNTASTLPTCPARFISA